jgi:hypothetical protein
MSPSCSTPECKRSIRIIAHLKIKAVLYYTVHIPNCNITVSPHLTTLQISNILNWRQKWCCSQRSHLFFPAVPLLPAHLGTLSLAMMCHSCCLPNVSVTSHCLSALASIMLMSPAPCFTLCQSMVTMVSLTFTFASASPVMPNSMPYLTPVLL